MYSPEDEEVTTSNTESETTETEATESDTQAE
jgi:hypothetical protein